MDRVSSEGLSKTENRAALRIRHPKRDRTRAVLAGMGPEVIDFLPRDDYVEAGMIEFAARQAGTQWVLRLDDDEFPSKALVQWLCTEGVRSRTQAIDCSRRDVFRRGGRYVYSRHPNRYFNVKALDCLAPHLRFFRPDRVKYNELLHSPGFLPPLITGLAPEQAFSFTATVCCAMPMSGWKSFADIT